MKNYKNDNIASFHLNKVQLEEIKIVKEKIENGTYKYENVSCAICKNSVDFELISEKDRYGFYFPLSICKVCGLIIANPRLRDVDYEDFYKSGHQKLIYVGKSRPGKEYFDKQYKRGLKIYKTLAPYIKSKNKPRVLEVGCGAGGILNVFKENGCTVKGIDLNELYLEYGKEEHGLDLSIQDLFEIKSEKYDIIIYSHVLEHLTDPSKHISFIRQILSEDGIVYIEVPGVKDSYHTYGSFIRYIQNAHVLNFTFNSVSNLMSQQGFVLLNKENEKIESVWTYSGVNENAIKNDYDAVVKYLKKNSSFPYKQMHMLRQKIKIYYRFIMGRL